MGVGHPVMTAADYIVVGMSLFIGACIGFVLIAGIAAFLVGIYNTLRGQK